MKLNKTAIIAILGLNIGVYGCSANNSNTDNSASADTSAKTNGTATAYTDDVREIVGMDHGKRTIRIAGDERISHPELRKNQANRFIVMSKKDYYLYVYEGQGADTVLLARYDCAFSQKKGNKQQRGDMKTPHCTMLHPFKITEIKYASAWVHDFGDGRGAIKSYGNYFLRLLTDPHKGIGIHGSTNNEESVPGRASEGCIRLKDEDIIDLRKNYAFVGMKVVIKAEDKDDQPFETRAFKKQNILRKRHLNPSSTLSNEQIQKAPIEFKATK
ncbi:MAG: L,D-transpeptidase [Paludibacteraceae bacterium]|nr:L,D-transpeptidase [Paludibacteraceae bacterium]